MTDAEYMATQAQVTTFCQLLVAMDLDPFIEAINHADAIGPFVDPTLWTKAHKPMHQIRQQAVALRLARSHLRQHVPELFEKPADVPQAKVPAV